MFNKSKLAVVTSPNLYTDANYQNVDENGLLSERIFGPLKNYKCKCGNFSSEILHKDQICKICGVKCASNNLRYKTFAKIVLPYPVYKSTFDIKKILRRIVGMQKYLLDPLQTDLISTTTNFLSYKDNKLSIVKTYDQYCVPLIIKGGYTFYLALTAMYRSYYISDLDKLMQEGYSHDVLVLPPKCRIVVINYKNNNRQLIKHKLITYYIQLLKLCQYDWGTINNPKQMDETWLKIIQTATDPITDDELDNYDLSITRYQHYINKLYQEVSVVISGKSGLIRNSFLAKSIDFSARAHIIVNPALAAYEIKIPRQIFLRLWFLEYLRFLYKFKNISLEDLNVYVKQTEVKFNKSYKDYYQDFIEWFFENGNSTELERLVLINRQPTLWKHGLPAVQVIGISETDTIELSVLILEGLNADFDGDCVACYRIHSQEAQKELFDSAYIKNTIIYDHNQNFLQTIRLEAEYAAYILLASKPETEDAINITNLNELPNFYETPLNQSINFNNTTYSYGMCLFNKYCRFTSIKINEFTNSNNISKQIFKNSKTNEEYQLRMKELSKRLFWFISTHSTETLTISPKELTHLNIKETTKNILLNLPKNQYIGQHVYVALTNNLYNSIPKNYQLKKLTHTRLNKTQVARIISSIGYIADANNLVSPNAIKTSLIDGLNSKNFFQTAYGTRKALVDKDKATPNSGYLERTLVMNLSPIELIMDDCKTKFGLMINIKNKKHAMSLINRWYLKDSNWELATESKIIKLIGQNIIFRSPVTCGTQKLGICRKCFGNYNIKTPYVGIVAGQCLAERLTQLSLRTFHLSGSCTLPVNRNIVNFISQHLQQINDEKLIFDNDIPNNIILEMSKIFGFQNTNHNIAIFQGLTEVANEDVTLKIKELSTLLKGSSAYSLQDIVSFYKTFIDTILSIGNIYSVFVEIAMANMFITDTDQIFRYQLNHPSYSQNIILSKKLGIKRLHTYISRLLGLLYEPNVQSIHKLKEKTKLPISANTIFEQIWALL